MKNTTVIIFGATGDLAKRKLIPALYTLLKKNNAHSIAFVGVAFSDVTAELMVDAARPFIDDIQEDVWQTLHACSYYKKVNFTHIDDYNELKQFVEVCEQKQGITNGNRLFYCATSAEFFSPITDHITHVGLAQKKDQLVEPWHRIIYEKPFGHDLVSARDINKSIGVLLNEHQLYRIDHYLTKEIVNNIAMIRFTNILFEPLWSNRYIDQIQIILSETVGVEGRGLYYDSFGAIRDVVQNHMLELLALVCMETPEKLIGDFIRVERAKVLEKIRYGDGIVGQYEQYRSEQFVNPDSKTETYASLQLFIDNPRWDGVPIYLKTGKCLDKKETVIHIKFKTVDCLLLKGCPLSSNWLTIRIAPDAVFSLTLNAKQPGVLDQVVPINMEFSHNRTFGVQTPEAYEVLLEEVIKGEQSIAVRFDEIEYAWDTIDTILTKEMPLYQYDKGSTGPVQAKEFEQKHGIRWKS